MAKTTQSVQFAAALAAAANYNLAIDDSRQVDGPVQTSYLDVATTTDNAQGDVIDLIELPPGAIVIPEQCKVFVTDDMSSGAVTFNIGDILDPDRYAVGINCAAVGTVEFISGTLPDGYTNRHKVVDTGDPTTSTNVIKLTLATLAAVVEAGAFRVLLAWKAL